MTRRPLTLLLALLAFAAVVMLLPRHPAVARGAAYHSPDALALSPDGKTLYAADATAGSVDIVSTADSALTAAASVSEPRGFALSADGKLLYVTSGDTDRVLALDANSRRVRGSVRVGHQPVGLALSADGKTLYCCNQFTDDVSVIDAGEMKETARISVVREPRFAALAEGGKTLVVSNRLPVGSNMDDALGAQVSLVNLADGTVTSIRLAAGATDAGQVCCSPDGRFAYIPHILARWLVPPTQLERGWMSTNALTMIDVPAKKRVNTVLLDDLDRGAANPWGAAISKDGATLFVTHAGVHEVQIIDTAKLHKLVNEWPADSPTALEDDLTAVYRAGVRQRVPTGGLGPRAVAIGEAGLFIANYFSGTVTRLNAATGKLEQTIALGQQPEADPARRGELLFHDARICFQGWQSCASCHPDGRVDGLAWDLLNDGIGNPKNARSLLLADKTPPMMSLGVREDMRAANAAGLKFILFHVPAGTEVEDIGAYISAMTPVRSPKRNPDGSLSTAARRGKAVFERAEVGCANCHPAPLFTDLKTYDVGTKGTYDAGSEFDTPTLVEAFRTGPYLHDGSAVTMREVLKDRNKEDKHGKTSQLSQELHDLIEYVLSL